MDAAGRGDVARAVVSEEMRGSVSTARCGVEADTTACVGALAPEFVERAAPDDLFSRLSSGRNGLERGEAARHLPRDHRGRAGVQRGGWILAGARPLTRSRREGRESRLGRGCAAAGEWEMVDAASPTWVTPRLSDPRSALRAMRSSHSSGFADAVHASRLAQDNAVGVRTVLTAGMSHASWT
jgi:hypothetical protein